MGNPEHTRTNQVLIGHSAVYGASKIVPSIVTILGVSFFTRLLTPAQYGEYALALAVAGFCSALGFSWLRLGLLRFASMSTVQPEELATVVTRVSIVIALLAAIVTVPVTVLSGYDTRLIWAAYSAFVGQGLFELQLETYRAHLKILRYALLNILRACSVLAASLLLVWLGLGATGLLLGYAAGTIMWSLPFLFSRSWGRKQYPVGLLADLLKYSAPFVGFFVLGFILDVSSRLLLAALHGAHEAGVFAATSDIVQRGLIGVLSIFHLATQPLVIRAYERGDVSAAREALKSVFNVLLLAGLPLVAVLAAARDGIVAIAIGPDFRADAAALLPVLAFATFIMACKSYYVDLPLQLERRTGVMAIPMAVAATLNVVMNLLWIPKHGAVGSAYALLFAYGAGVGVSIAVSRRSWPLPLPVGPLLASALLSTFLYFVTSLIAGRGGLPWMMAGLGAAFGVYVCIVLAFDIFHIRTWVAGQRDRKST